MRRDRRDGMGQDRVRRDEIGQDRVRSYRLGLDWIGQGEEGSDRTVRRGIL